MSVEKGRKGLKFYKYFSAISVIQLISAKCQQRKTEVLSESENGSLENGYMEINNHNRNHSNQPKF